MAWASQRSRRAINYAFIVVSDRISGPSCIFPSYTWAPFQSNWVRAKTAVASNMNRPLSSRQVKKEKLRHEGLVPVSKGSQAL